MRVGDCMQSRLPSSFPSGVDTPICRCVRHSQRELSADRFVVVVIPLALDHDGHPAVGRHGMTTTLHCVNSR